MLDKNTWNQLTVYKRMSSGSFENASLKWDNKSFTIYVKTGLIIT